MTYLKDYIGTVFSFIPLKLSSKDHYIKLPVDLKKHILKDIQRPRKITYRVNGFKVEIVRISVDYKYKPIEES